LNFKQNNLIKSLKLQPLIVVIRLEIDFFDIPYKRDKLFSKIEKLSNFGIKHIEIGWDSHPEWVNLISEIKNNFKFINIGVASINSRLAFDSILSLDLNYSMSPFFNKQIHIKAIESNQLVIPGISNIENFKEAIEMGYKIIKIFPASKLGIDFLNKLKTNKENDIFFIGAGGIKSEDLKILLTNGYNALIIGRELKNQIPDKDLEVWLKDY
tara:strand:+ start:340 stop:975 length:636 start_codon:yes stop_codon:yes gene_type:complete